MPHRPRCALLTILVPIVATSGIAVLASTLGGAIPGPLPIFPPGKRFPKSLRIDDQSAGMFPTLCIISSGSAISAAAYRKLGAFREDYFIEYIDIEYSLRANSRNVLTCS